MFEKTTLANGLRVVTSTMPHTRSVSVIVLVRAGSRYENDAEAGIAHVFEHMLFKGSEKWPSAQIVSESIEGVGGSMNASTDKEVVDYWCRVAQPHYTLVMELLADIFLNPLLDAEELEREQGVILEELRMYHDDPRSWVSILSDQICWPEHPLGRDIGGSPETVLSITPDMINDYRGRMYSPENTVLSVAGNVTHEQVVADAERLYGDWKNGTPGEYLPWKDNGQEPIAIGEARESVEQMSMLVSFPGLSLFDEDRYALGLMNTVLGEGMSSRLFLEVREKHGLAYSVGSYSRHQLDTGVLTVYGGVDPDQAADALRCIMEQIDRLQEPVPEAELRKAKEFTKGHILLGLESTQSVAGWGGVRELLHGELITADEAVARIEAVTVDDIQRVAARLFTTYAPKLAVIGPRDLSQELLPLVTQ
jgi:predicted Zn-dependent peptidase